jgi:glycoside/pentoside/hexuronide:cation symporter, GPH family
LLSWLTLQFVQQFLLLYTRYWLDAEANFQFYILVLQLTAFVFLTVWAMVSARIGKKLTYIAGASIWILAMLALFFVPQGQGSMVFVISFFAGMGVSTAYLIPWSMLPDVVDYDELQTGQRREGIYYGLFALLQQIGISFGVAIGSWALGSAGYVAPIAGELSSQPETVLFALRMIVSLAPVAMLALSIPLAMAYPISRKRHEEIMKQLELNRASATNDMLNA